MPDSLFSRRHLDWTIAVFRVRRWSWNAKVRQDGYGSPVFAYGDPFFGFTARQSERRARKFIARVAALDARRDAVNSYLGDAS